MPLAEIAARRSVREFKPDKVADDLITEIIKAGQFAPTSMNNRSVEFIVIEAAETKTDIFNVVGQDYVKNAPALIIPAIDITKSTLPVQDLSMATENMLIQAAGLGLGAVWKNVTDQWAKKIKTMLGIPKNFLVINLIPIGWPVKPLPPHTDANFDIRKTHFEKW